MFHFNYKKNVKYKLKKLIEDIKEFIDKGFSRYLISKTYFEKL